MDYPDRPPRYPTYIPVVITKSGAPQSGYIVDINANGACIAGIKNLTPDDTLHLRGAIETSAATVRWKANDRAGVHFERPIPPQYLAMLRLRGQVYTQVPDRPAMQVG